MARQQWDPPASFSAVQHLQLAVHRQWKLIWLTVLGSPPEHPAKAFLLRHSMVEAEARERVSQKGLLLGQTLLSQGSSHAYLNVNSLSKTKFYKPHLSKILFPSNTSVAMRSSHEFWYKMGTLAPREHQ